MQNWALPANATFDEARALLDQLGEASPDTIDASALATFDTSTVALLLEARRRAEARGATLAVHGAPPKLRKLAQLYGVEDLLALQPTA